MTDIPKRRKHRGGQRHAKLKQQRAARRNRLQSASTVGEKGEGLGSPPVTALFERPSEVSADLRLTSRAVRNRWPVDKRKASAILEKVTAQALDRPFLNSAGVLEPQTVPYSVRQVVGTCKLLLLIEGRNQADEHRAERKYLADRLREMRKAGRRLQSEQGVGNKAEVGGGVVIFNPDIYPEG